MQITQKPFRPLMQRATSISVGTTVTNTPLTVVGGMALRLVNSGTNSVSISFSTGADAGLTVANGHVLLPNTVEVMFFADDMTHINTIAGATGNTLSVSQGEGS